jgi:hypothetical protein
LIYACLVVLAGNAKVLLGNRSFAGDRRGVLTGLGFSAAGVIYARRVVYASWDELGVSFSRTMATSLEVAFLVLSVLTLGAALGARRLRRMGIAVDPVPPPGDLPRISQGALLRRMLLYLWFDTAVPEEILLRSILFAELRRSVRGPVRRVVLSVACFVGWHACLGWSEVPDHNPRALTVKFGSYALGSLIFTAPFLATSHVAGSIFAHWLTDCLLLWAGHPSGRWLKAVLLTA